MAHDLDAEELYYKLLNTLNDAGASDIDSDVDDDLVRVCERIVVAHNRANAERCDTCRIPFAKVGERDTTCSVCQQHKLGQQRAELMRQLDDLDGVIAITPANDNRL